MNIHNISPTATTEVTQRAEFECTYLMTFPGRYELCGHRYRIEVTVDGPQRFLDTGVVIEFDRFKKILSRILPDGKFLYEVDDGNFSVADLNHSKSNRCKDPNIRDIVVRLSSMQVKCFPVPVYPSIENLCAFFATCLQEILNTEEPGVRVKNVKLRENNDSFASWSR